MSPTHTAIATTATNVVEAIQTPTTQPGSGEVLVKVEYATLSAFDTYQVFQGYYVAEYPAKLGMNAAGKVVQVGHGVESLAVGDNVTAYTYRVKATQEYIVVPKEVVTKIPDTISLPSAVTIPNNFVTAVWSIIDSLGLSLPNIVPSSAISDLSTPILVYGSGTTVGQYHIQILKLAGYSNIITTASPKHHQYVRSLGAAHVFDYTSPNLSELILEAAGGGKDKIKYVVDCVTAEVSLAQIAKVTTTGAKVSMLLPIKEGSSVYGVPGGENAHLLMEVPKERNPFDEGVELIGTKAFTYQQNEVLKEILLSKVLAELLERGLIEPNRVQLIDTGSFKERVETALHLLSNNQTGGKRSL